MSLSSCASVQLLSNRKGDCIPFILEPLVMGTYLAKRAFLKIIEEWHTICVRWCNDRTAILATIFTTILATTSIARIKRFSLFPAKCRIYCCGHQMPRQNRVCLKYRVHWSTQSTEYTEVHRVHKEALQMRYCRTPQGHSSILVYYSVSIPQYFLAFYSIS